MSNVLIKVEGVSKKFCRSLKRSLWYGMQDLGREITGRRHGGNGKLRQEEFWAVKDVSFELKRGECLGLIGHNGAGKTTLLRMLNGLIKPDSGRIEMRGRVGALIALGAGFNPILTGRENIYVNASVLGLSKREIDEKIDEIIDFAEIGEFIDAPVQSYSSGMQMRLGFAVATTLNPDVLILDEVLAVGDVGFRTKCYNRIDKIADRSAIIFVTHSMPHVGRMCDKTIFMEKGISSGALPVNNGIARYDNSFKSSVSYPQRNGNGKVSFISIRINQVFLDFKKTNRIDISFGSQLEFEFVISSSYDEFVVVDVAFHSFSGVAVAECNNFVHQVPVSVSTTNKNRVMVKIIKLSLNPGRYKLSFLLTSTNMMCHYDWLDNLCELYVQGRPAFAGQQFIADWDVVTHDKTHIS